MRNILSPGDMLSDFANLTGDNRVIFRMFINTLVWGAIGTIAMIALIA